MWDSISNDSWRVNQKSLVLANPHNIGKQLASNVRVRKDNLDVITWELKCMVFKEIKLTIEFEKDVHGVSCV